MNDTIASISTAQGIGAISIVRMSGADSLNILNKIFKPIKKRNQKSHTINYGHIIYEEETIDEVLVSIMLAPNTYTKENIIEINCHGGIAVTNRILEILLLSGARLAEPGEYTKRAYLNGRIDLTQAESVMDLINVKTDKSRKVAISSLEGKTSNLIRKYRQKLLELIASIEVNIDYPEYDDAVDVSHKYLQPILRELQQDLQHIITKSENTKIIKNGINVLIIGRPNVGKSSLLNHILDENKAIVTNIEGTTRDIVEGSVVLDGVLLNITDTAGIRETDNIIEQIGVEKSKQLIDETDLVLVVLNINEELTKEDEEILKLTENKQNIVVLNKKDLSSKIDLNKLHNRIIVKTTTTDDSGLDELTNKIKELFKLEQIEEQDYNYLSNTRQIVLAKQAKEKIDQSIISLEHENPIDLIELDIKNAWELLGLIIGEAYEEELIDQLFSQFCLGK